MNTTELNLFLNQDVIPESVSRLIAASSPKEDVASDKDVLSSIEVPEEFSSLKDKERFEIQKEIARICKQTNIIKAPAGFGKTIIGILWYCLMLEKGLINGPVYWVCPQNSIAEDVFQNIIKSILKLKLNIVVELFLTNKRKAIFPAEKVNEDCFKKNCSAHIVVTNIDNFASPLLYSDQTHRMYDIFGSVAIFDEFHELHSKEAYGAAFIDIMKIRHRFLTTRTILLSATPGILPSLWKTNDKGNTILPNQAQHYFPQHETKYRFSVTKDAKVKDIPFGERKDATICSFNTVSLVQRIYVEEHEAGRPFDFIAHSYYKDSKKGVVKAQVNNAFCKEAWKIIGNKGTVISGPILEAAADISFNNIISSMRTPESALQSIGRVVRWYFNPDGAGVMWFDLFHNEQTERVSILNRYDVCLYRSWVDFCMNNFNGKSLTLAEIYELYNAFNEANYSKIFKYLNNEYEESSKKLSKFHLRRRMDRNDSEDSEAIIAAKTLRNSEGGRFCVVRDQENEWLPESFQLDNEDEAISECEKPENWVKLCDFTFIKRVYEKLVTYEAFKDLQKCLNSMKRGRKKGVPMTPSTLVENAKKKSMPIPISFWRYHEVLGLIFNAKMIKFLEDKKWIKSRNLS